MPAEKLEQTINKKVNTFHPKTSFRSNIYKVSADGINVFKMIMINQGYYDDHDHDNTLLLQ